MGLPSDTCQVPGCGTKLKPLFSSLYCPNEEEHGKSRTSLAKTVAAINSYYAAAGYLVPPCPHHSTVTMNGVTKCLTCGEELTTPYP